MRCADPCCCCWDLYGQVCSAFHFQQRDLMSSCCMVFIILHLHNCVIRFSQWTILFGVTYFLQINYQEILLLSHVGVWHLAGPPWVQREHVNAWYITDIGAQGSRAFASQTWERRIWKDDQLADCGELEVQLEHAYQGMAASVSRFQAASGPGCVHVFPVLIPPFSAMHIYLLVAIIHRIYCFVWKPDGQIRQGWN